MAQSIEGCDRPSVSVTRQEMQAHIDKINEMASVMRKAVEVDEGRLCQDEERIKQLEVRLRLSSGVMLCYVMLCHVMLCNVMLCYVMSCYVMLCHVMSCHVMLCHVMLCASPATDLCSLDFKPRQR